MLTDEVFRELITIRQSNSPNDNIWEAVLDDQKANVQRYVNEVKPQ